MKLTLAVFIVFISALFTHIFAQVFISYESGFSKITYQNQKLSKNYYTAYSPSLINTDLFYHGKKSYFRFNFSHQYYESLSPEIKEINYFENSINLENYQIIIEYLVRTERFSNGVNIYLGYQLRGLFSEFEQSFDSEFNNSDVNFSESVYADLSLLGRLSYDFRDYSMHYSLGFGLLRYFEESDIENYNEYNFYGLGFSSYNSFQSSLGFMFWLTQRIALKPQYIVNFDNTDHRRVTKRLIQSVLIGGVLKLW